MLTQRLNRLIDEGMLVKVPYEEHPPRYDYRFTDKGRAFWDVLAAMWRWGGATGYGVPKAYQVSLFDRETEKEVRPVVIDENIGQRLDVRRLKVARA